MQKIMDRFSNTYQSFDSHKLKEYLQFLLNELNRYKEDWEISRDELTIFKSEFNRFKEIVSLSNNLSIELKDAISRIIYKENIKSKYLKKILRYIFLWDAATFKLNQLEDKAAIETLEYDIRKILNKLILTQ